MNTYIYLIKNETQKPMNLDMETQISMYPNEET